MTDITDVIAAQGYANVLVSLAPSAALTADPEKVAVDLDRYFFAVEDADDNAMESMASGGVASGNPRSPRVRVFPKLGVALGLVDAAGLAALGALGEVERVGLAPRFSLIRPVATAPAAAAAEAGASWGIRRMGIDRLWQQGLTGRGVRIGHLDTGVDAAHPDLAGRIAAFAEFDFAGRQIIGAQPRDAAPGTRSAGHGTHTAGTLCARRNTARGSYGCAPGAQLASALVILGGDTVTRVIAGLEWVVEQRINVLSVSLGIVGFQREFETIVRAIRALDILPVFAVGNEGPNSSRSPGNHPNVLSIGASDLADGVSDFWSSQMFLGRDDRMAPDCVAPGGDASGRPGHGILSCAPGGGYR